MVPLRETPYAPGGRLLTGHERRTRSRCWRPHGTPTPLLVHTRRGRAAVRVDGRDEPHFLSPGDSVLWSPGAAQDFDACDGPDPWELVWAHFQPREHWADWLTWPRLGRAVALIPAPAERLRARIDDALVEMDTHARSAIPRATDLALNALERALLWLAAASPGPSRLDEPIREALLFVSRHLDRRLSVAEIAAAARLSPSRFAHLFTAQIGIPPARFVEQRRMERARVLLDSTSLPVGAIATATGFSSQFHFAARFRAHMETSPSDWRRRGCT